MAGCCAFSLQDLFPVQTVLQLLKASSHCSGAGRESWQAPRPGSEPTQAMPVRGRHSSAFKPSPLGVLASITLPPPPSTLSRSPHTPGRTSAHRWPSAYRCCRRGPSQGWGGGHACLQARQGGRRERKTVTALHGQGRLNNSMCTANPKGGCKADTCDYVKRWAGWMGSRRDHTACCTHSQSTWFSETKQKGDVQNVHDQVSMLGQYSHRAHRAGHAAGQGSGKPLAGMGRGYAVSALAGLLHRLKLNTLILWCSHRQGLRLILLLTPNNGISQNETCPDVHQWKPP